MILEDYLDTVQGIPQELQRQFTLMQELEGKAYDLTQSINDSLDSLKKSCETRKSTQESTSKESSTSEEEAKKKQDESPDGEVTTTPQEFLRSTLEKLREAEKHLEEKLKLSQQTFELVDRQVKRLDEDALMFEEEINARSVRSIGYGGAYPNGNGPNASNQGSSSRKKKRQASAMVEASGNSPSVSSVQSDKRASRRRDRTNATSNRRSTLNNNNNDDDYDEDSDGGGGPAFSIGRPSAASAISNPALNRQGNNAPFGYSAAGGVAPNSRAGGAAFPGNAPSGGPGRYVDPNEPVYCYCKQVSFGEMIACDNENCEIEWFHYECVGLKNPPKGKWYCNECMAKKKKGLIK